MKYYPLQCVKEMEEADPPDLLLGIIKNKKLCDEDATLEELHDYIFSKKFFSTEYKGKFQKLNYEIMFDRDLNKSFFPMFSMKDVEQRMVEWKDVLSTSMVLDVWKKCKMVYKVDNDFFHEIKRTENVLTSVEIFEKLPFNCFFIDLTEVENISNFKGAWVYITKDDVGPLEDSFCVNIYMSQNDNFTFFTYYSRYLFNKEVRELEWKADDLPKSDFIARTFATEKDLKTKTKEEIATKPVARPSVDDLNDIVDVTIDMSYKYDPRKDIVISIFQIMSFIAIDASDVRENSITQMTYKKPKEGKKIKNKFSEIKMWDVGIQYGKAIRVAKQEYKRRLREQKDNDGDPKERKDRKPTRPHIRRAHWQRYHVGKGRKETKVTWIGPIYVCGGSEIPVTIREIKK